MAVQGDQAGLADPGNPAGLLDLYGVAAAGRAGVRATYEDECFIFDVSYNKRYTPLNGDNGATSVLFQITFKTVGLFGLNRI